MMRLRLFVAVLFALLASAGVAHAGPVFFAVLSAGGGLGAAFGATALGSFLGTAVGRLLISVAVSALTRAKQPGARDPGLQTRNTQVGGVNPISAMLGLYATAGFAVCPPMSHGPANDVLTYVIDLGDVPMTALTGIYIDGEREPLADTLDVNGFRPFTGRLAGRGGVRFLDGTQTACDPWLLAVYGDYAERPWQATMIGRGVPYAIVNFFYDRERYQGLPSVRFEGQGMRFYDPRLDSTAGGAGAHRWADQSTWAFTLNPVVMVYNILRGITLADGSVWGGDATAADLPASVWFAAMNECDVPVEMVGGGTQPQFRAGFEFTFDDEPAAVIEELLKACNGTSFESGGQWKVRVGPPGLPVYFFTDPEVLVSRPQDLAPFPGLDQTINAIHARYPEPDQLWEAKDAPPSYDAAFEAEDGDRRLVADLSLSAVPFADQVQRLMRALHRDHRRMIRHAISLPPEAAVLEPMDTVVWASAANGYTAKLFEIGEVTDDPMTMVQGVSLREVDPSDYQWSSDFELPSTIVSPVTVPPSIVTVPGFSVAGITIDDGTGARRPALRLTWTPEGLEGVNGLAWEIRRTGGSVELAGDSQNWQAGMLTVVAGILPGLSYQVRIRPLADAPWGWTEWFGVIAPDVRLTELDLAAEVQAALTEATEVREAAQELVTQARADAAAAIADLRAAAEEALGDTLEGISPPLAPRLSALDAEMDSRIEDIARIDVDRALQVPREVEASAAIDTLSERLASLTLQLSRLRSDVTDAGIYIDTELGRARIEAVSRIDGTISEVVVLVDALRNQISLRATYDEVYAVVTAAQLDPTTLPIITDLVARLSEAELVVSGLLGAITAKADTIVLDGVSARVTTAEADIDSLEGQIALRVETAIFDALETRVGSAEVTLGTIDAPSISFAVQDARAAALAEDELSSLTLQQMMQSLRDRQLAQADIAYARQDLTALVTEDRESIATLRTDLGAAVAGSVALVTAEREARATESGALATAIDDVAVSVSGLSGALSEINRIEADSDSESARALRQVQLDLELVDDGIAAQAGAISALTGRVEQTEDGLEAEVRDTSFLRVQIGDAEDEQASGDLRDLLASVEGRSALSRGLADLRQDAWVLIEDGRLAVAGVRQEFTVGLDDAKALIDAERVARVTADEAGASDRLALRADLTAAAAALISEQQVRASADEALAEQATDLAARLTEAETGVVANATAAEVLTTRVTEAEGAITAQSSQITALNSSLTSTNTSVSTAQTAAQAALDLAGSKGKALPQDTAPGVADRNAQTLWIDTTGGANTPKRWNGSAWVAVTDKVATDAAAAAASALAQVATKAEASAVSALTTRVTDTESGISAQAAQVTELSTSVANNAAAISAEAATRSTADSAIAAQVSTLSTSVGANAAAIAAEAVTRSNADSALAVQVSTLSTSTGNNAAAITAETAARTSADTALAGQITSLSATVAGNASAITAEAVTRSSADSALAAQVSTLTTSVGTNAAAITAEAVTRSNADSALSAQVSSLSSSVGANAAEIEAEAVARSNADSALAAQISTLSTSAGTNAAAITAEALARTSADSALAAQISTLSTSVGNVSADISSEAVARSNADSALAGQIATVTASVGGLSAEATAQATAIATIEGRQVASQVFRARAGGAVGEIELVAASNPGGDAASEATIRSDRLKFLGNFAQFFSDVTINGDLIVTGSITTPRLAGNAVSVFRGVSGGGASPSTGAGALVTVFALSFEPADPNGMLMILMGGDIGGPSSFSRMRIKWRGVLLAEYGLPDGAGRPVTAILTSLAGAGVGTLIVEVEFGMRLLDATLLVGEFKR